MLSFFYRKTETVEQKRERVLNALKLIETPISFDLNTINEEQLHKVAQLTNGAKIHLSGNCNALSKVLLYNLYRGRTEIAVGNTYPVYEGVESQPLNDILFDKSLTRFFCSGFFPESLDFLHQRLLEEFTRVGQRIYSVEITRSAYLGLSKGHAVNLVILGNRDKPRIVMVDAWQGQQKIYSYDEFKEQYKKFDLIELFYHEGPVSKLHIAHFDYYSPAVCVAATETCEPQAKLPVRHPQVP